MYKEKVRKFKCYYCSDCKLYAGSETKTIHGRRMKPNKILHRRQKGHYLSIRRPKSKCTEMVS